MIYNISVFFLEIIDARTCMNGKFLDVKENTRFVRYKIVLFI